MDYMHCRLCINCTCMARTHKPSNLYTTLTCDLQFARGNFFHKEIATFTGLRDGFVIPFHFVERIPMTAA